MHHSKRLDTNLLGLRPLLTALLALSFIFTTSFTAFAEALRQDNQPTATVIIAALNVRSGPGVGYARIGGVKKGDVVTVIGQNSNCSWLQMKTDKGLEGWVSGSTRYVTLNGKCADIPVASATATTSATSAKAQTAAPTAIPAATPTPATSNGERPAWLSPDLDISMAAELEEKVPLESGKACVLFRSYINKEMKIEFTRTDDSKFFEVHLAANEEKSVCVAPGKYDFIIYVVKYGGLANQVRFYSDTRDIFQVYIDWNR